MAPAEDDIEQVVLTYLKSKGYKHTEAAFKEEVKTQGLHELQSASNGDVDTAVVNRIAIHNKSVCVLTRGIDRLCLPASIRQFLPVSHLLIHHDRRACMVATPLEGGEGGEGYALSFTQRELKLIRRGGGISVHSINHTINLAGRIPVS